MLRPKSTIRDICMEDIFKGVMAFKKHGFEERKQLFADLANSQNPDVLFITCSDSRIDPNLLTDTNPGDLFICRNAGNIVPPHTNETGGMTASIEFAVAVLGVKHIIICGHSDCGALKGAINPDSLKDLPHVKEWIGHCRSAAEIVKAKHGCLGHEQLDEVIQENVVMQIHHLRTHPSVATKLALGKVELHGWVYDIKKGTVNAYSEKEKGFVSVEEAYQEWTDK